MALLDLWSKNPDQLRDKLVHQLIAFAGGGKLLDDSPCSTEFRAFLATVPSKYLQTYAEQCLATPFENSGLALQDIVNEIGGRLGAAITRGRYRGTQKHTGFDGLWKFPNGRSIVVEVKTTDTYSINLNTIAGYRRSLISGQIIAEDTSSLLLVVGRQETDTLEAQIRGSKHAWDVRLISVDALVRLVFIKEELEDPALVQRIHAILVPHEFTRLDAIAELLFSATKEISLEQPAPDLEDMPEPQGSSTEKAPAVSFHDDCVTRLQSKLGVSLVKRTRTGYSSPDNQTGLICSVSKEYNSESNPNYWFAFHPHQEAFLGQYSSAYVAFGCGSAERIILIPHATFRPWIERSWTTTNEDRTYWHVVIYRKDGIYTLRLRKGEKPVDLTAFVLPPSN